MKLVYLHAPHLIEDEMYWFADVAVLDGEFVIDFFKKLPKAMKDIPRDSHPDG